MVQHKTLALGFDIGGSLTKLGLVDSHGKVLQLKRFQTRLGTAGLDPYLNRLEKEIKSLLNLAPQEIIGIGASFLGWINEDHTGPFFCMNAPALHEFNLKTWLVERFNVPVVLHDDIAAHTLAEYTFGAGRGARRLLCLVMGTGLGAGVILNGKLLQFSAGTVGDAGHLILRPGGPACASGCKGCAEALIGVAGIERLGEELYGRRVSSKEIIKAARQGNDPLAVEVLRTVGGYTGELLASLSNIFLPERIVLMGGTARAGFILLESVQQKLEYLIGDYRRTLSHFSKGAFPEIDIMLSHLNVETGVVGSVVDFFLQEG